MLAPLCTFNLSWIWVVYDIQIVFLILGFESILGVIEIFVMFVGEACLVYHEGALDFAFHLTDYLLQLTSFV